MVTDCGTSGKGGVGMGSSRIRLVTAHHQSFHSGDTASYVKSTVPFIKPQNHPFWGKGQFFSISWAPQCLQTLTVFSWVEAADAQGGGILNPCMRWIEKSARRGSQGWIFKGWF